MASPLLKAAPPRTISAAERVFVASASIWGIAIKSRLGKINADAALAPYGEMVLMI